MKTSLCLREWITIASLFGLIATLSAISLSHSGEVKKVLKVAVLEKRAQVDIEIEIEGAVKKPGVYKCTPGSTIAQILKEAGLDKTADRSAIDKKRILYSSQKVVIPKRKNT